MVVNFEEYVTQRIAVLSLCALLFSGLQIVSAKDVLQTVIPRPAVEPGILVSRVQSVHPTQQIHLEVFLDLNCPTSYEAYVEIILPLAEHFSEESRLVITAHLYPLPYHRNAMLSTQGAFAIMELEPAKTLQYLKAVLEQHNSLSTAHTRQMSEYEVLNYLTDLASKFTSVDRETFREHVDKYRDHVKKVWKYGARRGVAATPTFYINGVEMDLPDDSTLPLDKQVWINYIDQVLQEMGDVLNH